MKECTIRQAKEAFTKQYRKLLKEIVSVQDTWVWNETQQKIEFEQELIKQVNKDLYNL